MNIVIEDVVDDVFCAADVAVFIFSVSSTPASSSLAATQQVTPSCNTVALATVVKTTGDVSWSLAAMQAYQTLGCQTPVATGFGSTAFYGQSPSPHSSIPAAFYADGLSRFDRVLFDVLTSAQGWKT